MVKTNLQPKRQLPAKNPGGRTRSVPQGGNAAPARAAASNEPRRPPGTVRFYHGAASGKPGDWLTPQKQYAEGYAAKGANGVVYYVDVPEDHPALEKAFDDTGLNMKAPYVNFQAPPDIASRLKPLTGGDATPAPQPTRQLPPSPGKAPLLSDAERKQLEKQFGKAGAAEIERRLEEQEGGHPAPRQLPSAPPVAKATSAAGGHGGAPLPGSEGGKDLPDVLDRLEAAVTKLADAAEKLHQSGGGKGGGNAPQGQTDRRGKDADVLESAKGLGGQLGEVAQIAELIGALL